MSKILLAAGIGLLFSSIAFGKEKAPDFNYPETVIKNATKQIEKARKSNNNQALIDGLVRISIAKSLVSGDNMPEMVNQVDSAAAVVGDPCAESLLYSLEADILNAMYNNERYKYDNRQKAGTVRPADPRLWSREDYADRTIELANAALAHSDALASTEVGAYRAILTTADVCPEFIPTVYDMVAHHFVDLIAGVDHDKSHSNRVLAIYDSILEKHDPQSAAYVYTACQRIEQEESNDLNKRNERYMEMARKYADSPYGIEPIIHIIDNYQHSDTLTALARNAIKRYPNYPRIGKLKDYIDRVDQREVRISYDEIATPGKPIEILVASKNQKSVTITVYALPSAYRKDVVEKTMLKTLKVVKKMTFDLNGRDTVEFPALEAGCYALVPTFYDAATKKTVTTHLNIKPLRVTNIDIMMATRINDDYRLLVTDATTGKPIEGAYVDVREDYDGKVVKTLTTDINGYAPLNNSDADGRGYFQAYSATDRSATLSTWLYTNDNDREKELTGSVFTDRAVYRPGETVNFAVAAYYSGIRLLEVAKKKQLSVRLFNANHKCVAEQTLTTDDFGRISGTFALPTDGLTGTYTINVDDIASALIEVSEYKAPTFYLEVDREKSKLTDLSSVKIVGRAMTYSQFPLAGIKVKAAFSEARCWWMWDYIDFTEFETEATTDAEGWFTVDVPADNFSENKGTISINVELSATDSRGETQTSDSQLQLGKLSTLPELDDITANAMKPVALDNRLCQFDSLDYVIAADGKTVATGRLHSDKMAIDASNLPSGEYVVTLSIPDGGESQSFKLRTYRLTDKELAFESTLLIAEDKAIGCRDDGSFTMHWGNSSERWFHYVIACNGKVTDYGWHHAEAGMHQFTGKAEFAPRGNSCIWIYWMDGHSLRSQCLDLKPATPQDDIEIVTTTFRDNLTPGSKETWKLRVKNNNGKIFKSAMIVNMYDAALNSIADNKYHFRPAYISPNEFWQYGQSCSIIGYWMISDLQSFPSKEFVMPWLNYYDRGFSHRIKYKRTEYMRCNALAASAPMADMMVQESMADTNDSGPALDEVVVVTNQPEDDANSDDATMLRDEGVKTAFFLPGLVTDEDGEVTFTFDVPNRNTQWQFSAVAYTEDMHAAYINRIVTASKNLMVQPNVPRFVREGDRLTLAIGVMNNTDSEQTVDVTVDINGRKHTTKGVVIAPKSSQTVTESYDVPQASVIVVTTGINQDGRMVDGQRDRIAVLPATTDVVEATPFYLTADKDKATIAMPRFNKDGRLTFEYADNPAWYAATALPSMTQTAETATAHMANYYITAVASHIVKTNPEIAEAISQWDNTKSLQSPLQQNADLKTTTLDNTPWSRRADTETDMMRHLADITDDATVQYRLQRALTALTDLQRPDGGFEWFKGCRSSLWATEEVLRLFGYLNEMCCYPSDDAMVKKIVSRAVRYCDNQYADFSRREGVKRDDAISYAYDYVSIRSMLPVAAPTGDMAWMAAGAVDKAESRWGDYGIMGKAKAAMLLAANNRIKAARAVMESLRQTALKTADHGIYWDVDDADKVRVASYALKALNKINPDDPAIDGVRHWLLLSKQAQSWGSTVKACDALSALLSTGSNWTARSRKSPTIKIGRQPIDFTDAQPYFGYVRRTLPTRGGDISIRRDKGCPAWGAVYCQYNAPMDSVTSHDNADISLEKQFYVYDKANKLKPAATTAFTVGDRIQVRLVVRTNRDLDFVTVTDDRGACFEPADQLSFYDCQDGTFSYRETRDAATNIFFSHIAKGTYVITYDVFANNAGTYASGIATIQSQYAPSLTVHSAGASLTVE